MLGAGALLWLRHLYSPLQSKYGVGKGGAVVDLTSRSFWSDLASHVTGSSVPAFWIVVGLAVVAGIASLAFRDRRAAIVAAVWLLLPLLLLQVLTASSEDFAPERHLSFLLPGYAIALAGFALELGRLPGRRRILGAVVLAALLTPLLVSGRNDLSNFNADLRDASLGLAADFGPHDVLLTTAGVHGPLEDPRLLGAYAVAGRARPDAARGLEDGRRRQPVRPDPPARPAAVPAAGLAHRLDQAPARRGGGARRRGSDDVDLRRHRGRGLRRRATRGSEACSILGTRLWRQVAVGDPGVRDFRRMARLYRFAAHLASAQLCPQGD